MRVITAIDFEYTGSSPGFNSLPWQIGLITVRDGKVCPGESFSSLLRVPPEQPFNPYTPGRWASIREEISAAPALPELWPQLQPWLQGRALLAHHVPTERSLLQQSFPFHHFGPWLDSLTLARVAYPRQRSYKLEDLSDALRLTAKLQAACPGRQAHDALYDALACAYLLQEILAAPGWRDSSLEALCALKA